MNMIVGHLLLVLFFSATQFFVVTLGGWYTLLGAGTLATIQSALEAVPIASDAGRRNRVQAAILLVMASPDYGGGVTMHAGHGSVAVPGCLDGYVHAVREDPTRRGLYRVSLRAPGPPTRVSPSLGWAAAGQADHRELLDHAAHLVGHAEDVFQVIA